MVSWLVGGRKKIRQFVRVFLYSGNFNGSSANNRGSNGNYWSRSTDDNNGSYYLFLYSTDLSPSYNYYKNSGHSVRCLLGS